MDTITEERLIDYVKERITYLNKESDDYSGDLTQLPTAQEELSRLLTTLDVHINHIHDICDDERIHQTASGIEGQTIWYRIRSQEYKIEDAHLLTKEQLIQRMDRKEQESIDGELYA